MKNYLANGLTFYFSYILKAVHTVYAPKKFGKRQSLKHSQKSMRPQCIDIELQLVLFEHASLNLWGNNYIIIREITCNKNYEIAYYHALY